MRIIEAFLAILFITVFSLNEFESPIAPFLLPVSLAVLSCFYSYLGFAIFNGIRFRQIFISVTYKNISVFNIVAGVVAGAAIGICLIGIVFILQKWPGAEIYRSGGLAFSILIPIVASIAILVKRPVMAKMVLLRGIPLLALFIYIYVTYPVAHDSILHELFSK